MNGAADMGGMHGFGPVEIEPDEPVFHADWERRIFALNNAVGASEVWSLDAFRQARESIPPQISCAELLWTVGCNPRKSDDRT